MSPDDELEGKGSFSSSAPVEEEEEFEDEEEEEVSVSPGSAPYEQDDPIEDAYDLDESEAVPTRSSGSGRNQWKLRIKSIEEFLNTEIVYRFDMLEDHERAQLTGTYRLEVTGPQASTWMMKAANDISVVEGNGPADVVIRLHKTDFLRIVNGDINAQLSILSKKIAFEGDIKKVLAFNALISPTAD